MGKEIERDLDITAHKMAKWFSIKIPEAKDLRIVDLTAPESTGFSSDTFMFELHFNGNGKEQRERLVARLKPTGDFNIFPAYDISIQFNVMKILSGTDVPVPEMLWFEGDESILDVPFYVMKFVEGNIPTDNPPYHMDGWIPELSPQQRRDLWFNGLELLSKIHMLDWKKLRLDFLDLAEPGKSHIEKHLQYWDEFFIWGMKGQEHPICSKALSWLHENQPEENGTISLCWGDSRIANMIFRDQECVAVLDWEMARIGNPVEDLAWWIWMDRCFSEGLNAERLDGFPDKEATIDRWETLTGFKAENFEYYEIFAAFRFTMIMARVGMSMKHSGILPEDSDFDINNFASELLEKMLG